MRKKRYGSPPDGVSNLRWVNPNEATLEAGCRSSSSETRAAPRNPSPPMTAYDSGAEARRGRGEVIVGVEREKDACCGSAGSAWRIYRSAVQVVDLVSLVLLSAAECEGWFDQHQAVPERGRGDPPSRGDMQRASPVREASLERNLLCTRV